MDDRNEVQRKVAKLLRLAERGGTPEEAATAAARAQEMIDRYKLDRAALDFADEASGETITDYGDTLGGELDANTRQQWRGRLAVGVAAMHGCTAYRGKGRLQLVGRASNAEAVRYLYAWLAAETVRLTDQRGRGLGVNWRNNFALGVVETVARRFKEQRETTIREARERFAPKSIGGLFAEAERVHESQALVRVERAIAKIEQEQREVYDWARRKLHLVRTQSSIRPNGTAREAGRRAGESVRMTAARGALGCGQ